MKIVAVAWNYPLHNAELGEKTEKPLAPKIFMKPETAVLKDNEPFYLPEFSQDMQYETELVFRISKMGKSIGREFAARYIDSIGLGVDFTARDLQRKFKDDGSPWELCKAFDNSAPVSSFFPVDHFPDYHKLHFHLLLNGEKVQEGYAGDMFFNVEEIIEYVTQYITLKSGDLIFTGTPAGVGRVKVGDRLCGYIEDEKMFDFEVM